MSYDFLADDFSNLVGKLYAFIPGVSGAGKSYLLGTYPGKVLHITGKHEAHGGINSKLAARQAGNQVISVRWDLSKGQQLNPDQALMHLRDNLLNAENLKAHGVQCVALDGATELEQLIKSSQEWRMLCKTKSGDIDGFKTGSATISVFRSVLDRLNDLHTQHGIDVLMTGIIDVSEISDRGEILNAKPQLSEYNVAQTIIMTFGTILPIGEMVAQDGSRTRRLQFQARIIAQSKHMKTQLVKKFQNFTPRVQGFKSEDTPRTMPADLGILMQRIEDGDLFDPKPPIVTEEDNVGDFLEA